MSLSSSQTPRQLATFEDLLAIPESERFHEILDGELLPKEATSGEHSLTQGSVRASLDGFAGQKNGPSRPGGWWLLTEPTVRLSAYQTVRPDLAGWRRERMPGRPAGFPLHLRPDWVCEIHVLGDARRRDTLQKRRIYAEHGVPHYWLLDAERETLTVLRLVGEVFVEVQVAGIDAVVRAEPFESVALPVAALFGHDAVPEALR